MIGVLELHCRLRRSRRCRPVAAAVNPLSLLGNYRLSVDDLPLPSDVGIALARAVRVSN